MTLADREREAHEIAQDWDPFMMPSDAANARYGFAHGYLEGDRAGFERAIREAIAACRMKRDVFALAGQRDQADGAAWCMHTLNRLLPAAAEARDDAR